MSRETAHAPSPGSTVTHGLPTRDSMIQSVKSRRVSNFSPVIGAFTGRRGGFLCPSGIRVVFQVPSPLNSPVLRLTEIAGDLAIPQSHGNARDRPALPGAPCSTSLTSANVAKPTATAVHDRSPPHQRSALRKRCECGNIRTAARAPQRLGDRRPRNAIRPRAGAWLVLARRHRAATRAAELQVVRALHRLTAQRKRRRVRSRQRRQRALGQACAAPMDQAPSLLLRHDRRVGRSEPRARARLRRLTPATPSYSAARRSSWPRLMPSRHALVVARPALVSLPPGTPTHEAHTARESPAGAGLQQVPLPGFEPGFPP